MLLSLSKVLPYVTPGPLSALKTIYDYASLSKLQAPSPQEFKAAVNQLLGTAIAVTAFLSSAKAQSKFGGHFNNALTLGSICIPGALSQTLLARTLVTSFQGSLNAVNGKNPRELMKNIVMGLLACAASSKAVNNFYHKWIVGSIAHYFKRT